MSSTTLQQLKELGESLGLHGNALFDFIKEQQNTERGEREKLRQEKEKERLHELERQKATLVAGKARLDADQERQEKERQREKERQQIAAEKKEERQQAAAERERGRQFELERERTRLEAEQERTRFEAEHERERLGFPGPVGLTTCSAAYPEGASSSNMDCGVSEVNQVSERKVTSKLRSLIRSWIKAILLTADRQFNNPRCSGPECKVTVLFLAEL